MKRRTFSPALAAAAWLPAAFWYRIIWGFSAQTAEASGDLSGRLLWRILDGLAPAFRSADRATQDAAVELLSFFERKAAHMLLYFILALLLWFALSFLIGGKGRKGGVTALLCVVLAALDEYHQTLVPGRSGQVQDVLVDLGGVAAALAFLAVLALAALCRREKTRRWAAAPAVLGGLFLLMSAAASEQWLAQLPIMREWGVRFIPAFWELPAESQLAVLAALAPIVKQVLFLAAAGLLGCCGVLSAAVGGLGLLPGLGVSAPACCLLTAAVSLVWQVGVGGIAAGMTALGVVLSGMIWLACRLAEKLQRADLLP